MDEPKTPTKLLADFEYALLGAPGGDLCIYYAALPQALDATRQALRDFACPVVYLVIRDWDNQLTPWPAKGLYKGDADFKGEAAQTLATLVNEFIPAVEAAEGLSPKRRAIAGYSLAGLFSTYAFADSDVFTSVASMSGSFWYEGWVDYLSGLDRDKSGCFAYLSLGNKEAKANPPILHSVQNNTNATADILRSWGAQVENRSVPGTHFDHMLERVVTGLNALAARPGA